MTDPQAAIEALATGGLSGSPRSALQLVKLAWPLLERFVLRRLKLSSLQGELLKDCGQNSFERVWKHRTKYRGQSEAELWSWIRQICENERSRLLKSELRQNRTQLDEDLEERTEPVSLVRQ